MMGVRELPKIGKDVTKLLRRPKPTKDYSARGRRKRAVNINNNFHISRININNNKIIRNNSSQCKQTTDFSVRITGRSEE